MGMTEPNPYESPKHASESLPTGERWFCAFMGFLAGVMFVCTCQMLAQFVLNILLKLNW
jgi:hypothetical protein